MARPTNASPPGDANAAHGAGAAGHHVHVQELRGNEARDLDPALSPTLHRQLEACHGSSGGKLRVRVRREGGRLSFEAEPSASLDPTERACVLDALRRAEVEQALSTGANVPPTGFTSLLTIEW